MFGRPELNHPSALIVIPEGSGRLCLEPRVFSKVDIRIFLFLIAATALETLGDAIVRMGIGQAAWLPRAGLFAAGAVLLFGYGLSLNLAPIEFNRVVGLYIATLFVMWQIVNLAVFRTPPGVPVLLGGVLIVIGGLIVTFWK